MKTTALAIALLMSGAAIAQTTTQTTTTTQPELDIDADVDVQPDGDLDLDADVDVDNEVVTTTHKTTTHKTATHATTTHSMPMAAASGAIVQPSNSNPERDARGIAVISDPAVVPAGFNGTTNAGMGGPVEGNEGSYPACSRTVTDNCIQTYEVGRS
jgi:uncharacterized protein YpuA (DUF1002 family)